MFYLKNDEKYSYNLFEFKIFVNYNSKEFQLKCSTLEISINDFVNKIIENNYKLIINFNNINIQSKIKKIYVENELLILFFEEDK